jgi:hypothetical protein
MKLITTVSTVAVSLTAIALVTPARSAGEAECPLTQGQVVSTLVTSDQLVKAMSLVPAERDEYQTTADYQSIVQEALGPLSVATTFEVDEGDRSFFSYNADKQRIEIGIGHFDFYSTIDFDTYQLRDYFNLTIDDFDRYMSEHLIVGLGESKVATKAYDAANSFGVSTTVTAYNRVSVHVHGGLYENIDALTAWSFEPDEFINTEYGIKRPVITIPMASEVARSEMPSLRAVIATSGLGEEFLVTEGYFSPTINRPEEITSTNFLFTSEILCGAFIDSNSMVVKVVQILDEQVPYPE